MLKVYNYDVVCQELPMEVSLALNISGCPYRCPGCHSPHLWEDVGEELTEDLLGMLMEKYGQSITCVCFMGGDADYKLVEHMCSFIKKNYVDIHTAWWSGRENLPEDFLLYDVDYVKLGPYIQELGGLRSPKTNQRLYTTYNGELVQIKKFSFPFSK